MQTIQAHEKLTTRQRQPMEAARPVVEIKSTHCATCPYCQREAKIFASSTEAHVHNGCGHILRIERSSNVIEVVFDEVQKRAGAAVST